MVTQTDARKGDAEFTYFAGSAILSAMIDPADLAAGRITEVYQYNAAGRRIATTDALNQTRRFDHDLHGRVVKEWGSASYPVERIYCSCGKIAELRTYRGGSGWDGATWPTATAGAFDKTTWTYGTTTGLLLAKTDANNASVSYAYDSAGRMTSRTWARGVVTSYAYNPATGELLTTSYSDGTPTVTNTFDRRGRVASVVDGVGSRTFGYTAYGQVSGEAITLTGFGTGSLSYTYDSYGRRTMVGSRMQRSGYSMFGQNWPHAYEAGTGLLSSVGSANSFSYSYLANSVLPASIGSVNSESKDLTWAAHRDEQVAYDNRYSSGYSSAHRFEFARDAVSRITMKEQFKEGSSLGYDSFAYNARSELVSDTGQTLSYDSQGNRLTGYGSAYQPNALNQYVTVGGATWTHDADGNPLSDGTQTHVYDAENRLVQVTKGAMVFTFAYDYRHRLVKHTGHWQPWGGSGVSQPGTSWRLYDGDRIALRSDTVGGYTQEAEYVWGRDLAGRHAGGDGTGGLLMVRSNGISFLPRNDGQGNIWGFSGGYSRSLKAFGQVTFEAQNVPVSVPLGLLAYAHGSKEYFGELGLYNYGRRFYDPKLGRFVGRDPIAEEGGMNLYRFAGNNPVNRWDYLGMCELTVIDYEWIPSITITIPRFVRYDSYSDTVEWEDYTEEVEPGYWSPVFGYECDPLDTPDLDSAPNSGIDLRTPQQRAMDESYAREVALGRGAAGQLAFGDMSSDAVRLDPFVVTASRVADVVLFVGGVFFEPLDWAATAREIYYEPGNPWSYAGLLPIVPAAVGKIGKAAHQFKKLSPSEIKDLIKAGYHPHDLKPNSKFDLFKDDKGEVFVMPKNGSGPGDPTGININNPGGG